MQRATLTARHRRALPSCDCLPAAQLPPARTQHDSTWYGIPCSVWLGWVSPASCVCSWLLVKINPVLAEPRTHMKIGGGVTKDQSHRMKMGGQSKSQSAE